MTTGGSSLTKVTISDTSSAYTSTATSDTLYVIDDGSNMSGLTFNLPSASSAGIGTKITVMLLDLGYNSATITANGSDTIYDAYDESSNMNEGISDIGTMYPYIPITLMSDGAGFWLSETSHEGMWYNGA